jgi:hypothetical protein
MRKTINRQKRNAARALIDRFLKGEIDSGEFDAAFPHDPADAALVGIHNRLWFFWDDRYPHRLTGKHTLHNEARAAFDRCMSFLASDLEYTWPKFIRAGPRLVFLRALEFRKKAEEVERREQESLKNFGELDVWPLASEEDYKRAGSQDF